MNKVKVLTEFFFSNAQGKSIVDSTGRRIGKVKDMVVLWNDLTPHVTGIKTQQGLFPIELVDVFENNVIKLTASLETLQTKPLLDNELYVGRWLLDKQIIDLKGSRLVRVNDITLSWVMHENKKSLILVAADIGVRGIFRRIGLEFLVKGLKNNLIGLQYIKPLEARTSRLQLTQEKQQLEQLHPADIADLIEQMDYKHRSNFLKSLDYQQAVEAISEMDLDTQIEVIAQMDANHASDILEEMPPDEAADILGEMSPKATQELLNLMANEEAEEVRGLMEYPDDSAGGLMTTEYVWFLSNLTVSQAVDNLRTIALEVETAYYIYILDEAKHLLGVISLKELILASPDKLLESMMHKKIITVKPYENYHKVAETVSKYGLFAAPVVNDNGSMLGIVTVDDILQLLLPERSVFNAGLLFKGSKIASRRW